MNNTVRGSFGNGEDQGQIKIIDFIDDKYRKEAEDFRDYLKSITLTGDRQKKESRTKEDIQKDLEAADFIRLLKERATTPAQAYGYMLYDESSITKIYWAKRVGKTNKYKKPYFEEDPYLEWLVEIYTILLGKSDVIKADPTYYAKIANNEDIERLDPNTTNKIISFDIMNSFTYWWNQYCLLALSNELHKRDMDIRSKDISIDSTMSSNSEADNKKKNAFDSEISANGPQYLDPQTTELYLNIEDFLHEFTKEPWNQGIPLNKNSTGSKLTYLSVLKEIVKQNYKSLGELRDRLGVSGYIFKLIVDKIQKEMKNWYIEPEDFNKYISIYKSVALRILAGQEVSFTQDQLNR